MYSTYQIHFPVINIQGLFLYLYIFDIIFSHKVSEERKNILLLLLIQQRIHLNILLYLLYYSISIDPIILKFLSKSIEKRINHVLLITLLLESN